MPACFSGCFALSGIEFFERIGPCQAAGGPPGPGGLLVGDPFCWRAFFAQRFAGQRETVMVLHEAIKHGIGHSLVAYPLMPVLNGQLAGD